MNWSAVSLAASRNTSGLRRHIGETIPFCFIHWFAISPEVELPHSTSQQLFVIFFNSAMKPWDTVAHGQPRRPPVSRESARATVKPLFCVYQYRWPRTMSVGAPSESAALPVKREDASGCLSDVHWMKRKFSPIESQF